MISEVSQVRRRLETMLGKKNKPRQSHGDQRQGTQDHTWSGKIWEGLPLPPWDMILLGQTRPSPFPLSPGEPCYYHRKLVPGIFGLCLTCSRFRDPCESSKLSTLGVVWEPWVPGGGGREGCSLSHHIGSQGQPLYDCTCPEIPWSGKKRIDSK
jgi:hypothetical protein